MEDGADIIDWVHFEKSRAELGPGFIRILSYFREDGAKSIAAIEQAMHEQNTVALVIPAHTLKGESRQFGAEPIAAVAELIEQTARFCIETHRFPDELVPEVVELRRLWSRPLRPSIAYTSLGCVTYITPFTTTGTLSRRLAPGR